MAGPRQLHKRKRYLNEIAECKALHCFLSFPSSPGTWNPEVLCSIKNPDVQLEREPLFWQPSRNNPSSTPQNHTNICEKSISFISLSFSHCDFIDLLTEFTKSKNPCAAPRSPLQWITGTIIICIKEEKKTKTLCKKDGFHFERTERARLFYILLSFVTLSARC